MFVRQSVLIATAYLVLAFVAIVSAYVGYLGYSRWGARGSDGDWRDELERSENRLRGNEELQNAYAPALLARANQRLTQLQVVLDKTSETLQQKTEQLNQRTAECRALQKELDETLTFILESVSADNQSRAASKGTDDAPPNLAVSRLEMELRSLRDDMSKADFLEEEQAATLDQLTQQLLQTEAEVEAVLQQTQAELDTLAAEKEALATVATQTLLRLGAAAVPALTDLLMDDRAAVRSWAASVLGEMGSVAQDAAPTLTGLLIDSNAEVRDAAQRALTRIVPAKTR